MKRSLVIPIVAAWTLLGTTLTAQQKEPVIWAELHPKAEISGRRLLLRDVARVQGTDEKAAAEAGDLLVAEAPLPGQVVMLRRSTVAAALAGRGSLGASVILRGAEESVITARSVSLSGEDLVTLAVAWLSTRLGPEADTAQVTRTWRPEPLTAPAGRWSTRFEVHAPRSGPMGSGIQRLEVRPVVDGEVLEGRVVEVALRLRTSVLIATNDLLPQRPVDGSRVRLERREIPGDAGGYISDYAELQDLVTRARIRKGEPLRRVDFKRRPIVRRNQQVRVIYRNGALTVTGSGIAQGQGARGDRIPVMVGKKKRTVFAVIVDSKTVESGPSAGKERVR